MSQLQRQISDKKLISFSEFLVESASATIKALVDEFTDLVVYCRSEPFDISVENNAERIFNVLNRMLFKGKLDAIPLFYGSVSELSKIRKQQNPDFGAFDPNAEFFGVFSSLYDFIVNGEHVDELDESTGVTSFQQLRDIETSFFNRSLMFNKDLLKDANFIFCTNCICHEMIHLYDSMFGDMPYLLRVEKYMNQQIDDHSSPTFRRMQAKAGKEKLKVIGTANGIDIQKMNDEAYSFMMLGEEEFKDKKLRVIKNAKGQWVVDMTQFSDTDHSIGVAPQYAELRCID